MVFAENLVVRKVYPHLAAPNGGFVFGLTRDGAFAVPGQTEDKAYKSLENDRVFKGFMV